MRLSIFIIFIFFILASCQKVKEPNAQSIIVSYYKSKNQAQFKVLSDKKRIILDSVVVRLEESNEPEEVIQYIVNEYKVKYGD